MSAWRSAWTTSIIFIELKFLVLLSLVPVIFSLVLSLFLEEPKIHQKTLGISSISCAFKVFQNIVRNPALVLLSSAKAISYGFSEAAWQFRATFIKTVWPLWGIGILNALDNVLAFAGYRYGGKIMDKMKHKNVIVFHEIVNGFFYTLAIALKNIMSQILMAIPGFFWASKSLAQEDLLQRSYSDEYRATMGSFLSFYSSIVYSIASISIGLCADLYGAKAGLLFATLIQLLTIPLYLKYFLKHKKIS